ncbi:MAG: MOSC domain-containing protein [Candidatus Nanopelagicales bacterium]
MARISAVCVVHTMLPEPANPDGLTAIDKRAVIGPVEVGPLGLAGDSQKDTAHHGGQEYAVYLYAEEDVAWWSAALGREIPPGLFGENLSTFGLEVSGLVIGARYRIGDSGLEVEVTSPRNPCATFARRMNEPHWVKRFTEQRAPGAYVRVLTPGTVQAGDEIVQLAVPEHGITVADLMRPARSGAAAALLAASEVGQVVLGERMRADATKQLGRG